MPTSEAASNKAKMLNCKTSHLCRQWLKYRKLLCSVQTTEPFYAIMYVSSSAKLYSGAFKQQQKTTKA